MLRHMPASRAEVMANIRTIQEAIRSAAERAGRDPATVELVAAAKTVPAEPIAWAAEAGVRSIGHNYVRELRSARATLPDLHVRWHYIGALQAGTAHQVADAADVVQTVGGGRGPRPPPPARPRPPGARAGLRRGGCSPARPPASPPR